MNTNDKSGTKTDIEALMRPRYKVIADYPLSNMYFNVGDILYWNEKYESYRIDEKKVAMNKDTVESYPHLFKPLAWYEDREASEMPAYVKHKSEFGGRVYKLSDAKESYGGINFMYDYPMTEHWVSLSECLPTTESYYLQYINNQNKK